MTEYNVWHSPNIGWVIKPHDYSLTDLSAWQRIHALEYCLDILDKLEVIDGNSVTN